MEDLTEQTNGRKRINWIIGGILIVMLFATAAFVGGRLLNRQAEPSSDVFEVDFTNAEEIPDTEPEIVGVVTAVEGDTLTVQEFGMNNYLGMTGASGVIVESFEIENPEDLEDLPMVGFI